MSSLALSRALELRRLQADCNEREPRTPSSERVAVLPTSSLELLAVHIENTIRAAIGTDGARRFLPALHDAQDALRSELSRRGGDS